MNRLLYTCVSRNSPRGCLQNFPANSKLGIVCLIMGNHLTSIFRTVWLPGKRNWWPLYWCDENTVSAHLRRVNFPFTKARLDGCRWHHSCRHMIGKMSCEWCYCLPTPVTPSWPFHGLSKNETVKWLRSKCFYPSINSCRCVCVWLAVLMFQVNLSFQRKWHTVSHTDPATLNSRAQAIICSVKKFFS